MDSKIQLTGTSNNMKEKYRNKFIKEFINFLVPKSKSYLLITSRNHNSFTKKIGRSFDYIIILEVLEETQDIIKLLKDTQTLLKKRGKLVIIYNNYLYNYIKQLFNKKSKNWLSTNDIRNFLQLSNYESFISNALYFFDIKLPLLNSLINRIIVHIFPISHFAKIHYIIAKKIHISPKDLSTSIIIPARNEKGNIENIFNSLSPLGTTTEVIFVEGNSVDGTKEEIIRCINKYSKIQTFSFHFIDQGTEKGKADAVRKGFAKAKGEVLFIYDADVSINPNDLSKFYKAIISNKGEFINGSRLVYPMEKLAMQSLNILGNKFFSLLYSWILDQKVKDTLCGTKVIWKNDYLLMKNDRYLTGNYDPFGDFELLIGARKLNLKIIDLPIRYYERKYGKTNIKRFSNGLQLAKYSLIAIKKLKLRKK